VDGGLQYGLLALPLPVVGFIPRGGLAVVRWVATFGRTLNRKRTN